MPVGKLNNTLNKLALVEFVLFLLFVAFVIWYKPEPVLAQITNHAVPNQRFTDDQSLTLLAASLDAVPTPSTGATRADIEVKFGTVSGTYTTCTVQLKTTYNGTDFLTIGTASSVTVTSNTINAFTIMGEAPVGTGVTNGAVSGTAALTIGRQVKITAACSGGYGTSAPFSYSITLS